MSTKLNRDLPKMDIFGIPKFSYSYIYFPIIRKRNLVVLRVDWKILSVPEF